MVMHATNPSRVSDGCNDRRDPQACQSVRYHSKGHSANDHRHEKMRDSSDSTPPTKMLRRSDSPDKKHSDGTHSQTTALHIHRPRERESGISSSPQENSHHVSSSHPHQNRTSEIPREPADDWSEHISSSGKKYYYNCRTEVSQWEKPKEWQEREQRPREGSKTVVNSFPKDRDYRQEAMQASATSVLSSTKSTLAEKPISNSSYSQPSSINPSSTSSSSSSSTVPVSPALQASASTLLQDPALLRQLLPALQATLQMNHANADISKINEVLTAAVTQASLQSLLHKLLTAGPSTFNITTLLSQAAQLSTQAQQSGQSPMSLASDASSPRSYLSPRVSTPQTNAVSKPLHSLATLFSQPKVTASIQRSGSTSQQSANSDKQFSDPRLHRQISQESMLGSNSSAGSSSLPAPVSTPRTQSTFTPSLALHFDENLIRHVQGWPAEHVEKQVSRLCEDIHNMGTLYMSEICTELKNLRSLVRVCEIQATLREQRILFLRQQIKELDKLKNQNSFMV
ncbi:WW domain-containing adapter protein with coiled-coil-like isoform X1 [Myxocyprinus asiaticus]|uniref:WW domain-containing adapter protein with coiled-coil-like isoform X1 n=1 Tax=Myxocyprinus asiaticus TaxID=70543 RepID=UPI00222176AD|nr:WW domain-containing adapter protein with coiled-coil-like isoform X1 [Myxocyprinus asiaticus]